MRSLALASPLLLSVLSGCVLLADDDDDCNYGGYRVDGEAKEIALPAPYLRNPDSGQCEELPSTGGGGECDACGRCPPTDEPAPEPVPDWGECQNVCTGLDEPTCLATDGCRAAYLSSCVGGGCPDDGYDYYACWAIAPAGATRGGDCSALGAYDCSRHDDCVTRHALIIDCVDCTSDPSVGGFESCAAEPEPVTPCAELDEVGCVAREDCAPFYEGVDCTCDADTCSCADWVFRACE